VTIASMVGGSDSLAAIPGAARGSATDEPTTLAGVLRPLAWALDARGLDGREVYAIAGLEGPPANNPLERIPTVAMRRVMDWAVEQSADPLIGLDIGGHLRPQNLHALGHSLQSSRNLRDFALRLSRFFRLLSSAARTRLVVTDADAAIEFDIHELVPSAAEDALTVFLVGFARELSGDVCQPWRIELRRPLPADGGARHRRAMGCPVAFGHALARVCYEPGLLEVPFIGSSDELAEHNDSVALSYLTKLDQSNIEARVKTLAVQGLRDRKFGKAAIAALLHMSARTLQHRLERQGTSFQQVIEDLRRDLACAYLEDRSRSIGEVSYLVGFASVSNFSRAFRRWTGLAPAEYRRALSDGTRESTATHTWIRGN
jgi:AraC-like DNA-binding protein